MRQQTCRLSTDASTIGLTKKKRGWIDQFKPTAVLRGSPIVYPTAVERYYVRAMEQLLRSVNTEFEKKIKKLFKTPLAKKFFTTDETLSSQTRILINALTDELTKFAEQQARKIADKFTRNINATNASALHASFEQLSGGLQIKTIALTPELRDQLKTIINVNATHIKTLATKSVDELTAATYRSIMSGRGLADLVPFFQKHNEKNLRHGQLVALDQTRKAYTALTAVRMHDADVQRFEWRHSGGTREPRQYHLLPPPTGLNGGIFELNDPPVIDQKTGERGLPGQAINCTCIMIPILQFDKGQQQQ